MPAIDEKHRPRRWADVAGNESAVKLCRMLAESVRDTGAPEVALLTGPSGVGKTTVAELMARTAGATEEYQIERLGAHYGKIDEAHVRAIADRWAGVSLFGAAALIMDEVDEATDGAQRVLKGFLEDLPRGSIVIMTSNLEGDGELFCPLFRGPLLRRAHPIHFTTQGLATRKGAPGPAARRVQALMAAEGMDGRDPTYYVTLVHESKGNIGAAITRAWREAVLAE